VTPNPLNHPHLLATRQRGDPPIHQIQSATLQKHARRQKIGLLQPGSSFIPSFVLPGGFPRPWKSGSRLSGIRRHRLSSSGDRVAHRECHADRKAAKGNGLWE